jgi:hypothetical protein
VYYVTAVFLCIKYAVPFTIYARYIGKDVEEAVLADFKVLSQHGLGATEVIDEKPQDILSLVRYSTQGPPHMKQEW